MSTDRIVDAEECKNKGNMFLQEKDYDKAIQWYTQAIEFHKSHVYYSNRSAAYLSKGYADTALKDADLCINLKPDWPKGYGRKAAALHKLKKYDEAIAVYKQGLEVAPGDESLSEGLKQVEEDMKSPEYDDFGGGGGAGNPFGQLFGPDMFDKIKSNPKLSKYMSDPSYLQIMATLQKNPNMLTSVMGDPRVMETLSELLGINLASAAGGNGSDIPEHDEDDGGDHSNHSHSHKKPETKKEEIPVKKEETEEEKAARELKEKADAFKNEGNEFYKKKDFSKAMDCYTKALEVLPTEMTYMLNIASVKLEEGDLINCISQCEKAIEVGRENRAPFTLIAKAYERMGNAYARFDKIDEAIISYRKAQVESHQPTIDQTIKKLEKKLKEKQELSYIDPTKGAEAKERGNEAFKKGAFPEAVKEYSEAIRRDPKNAVYFANRSAALTKLMDFGRAKEDIIKAIELDPKYVRAYAKKGNIEYAIKDYKGSMDSYQKGLKIDPDNEECKEGLVKVSMAIQNSDEYDTKERQQRAMEDPEIRGIMTDPVMMQVLRDMSTDPKLASKHMSDPVIASKIQKLIAAGVVQTR